jgi:hypothetical protein
LAVYGTNVLTLGWQVLLARGRVGLIERRVAGSAAPCGRSRPVDVPKARVPARAPERLWLTGVGAGVLAATPRSVSQAVRVLMRSRAFSCLSLP